MSLTQKDYFNTDINITWFAQAECLPCCDWNWGLQSVSCSPNASSGLVSVKEKSSLQSLAVIAM